MSKSAETCGNAQCRSERVLLRQLVKTQKELVGVFEPQLAAEREKQKDLYSLIGSQLKSIECFEAEIKRQKEIEKKQHLEWMKIIRGYHYKIIALAVVLGFYFCRSVLVDLVPSLFPYYDHLLLCLFILAYGLVLTLFGWFDSFANW